MVNPEESCNKILAQDGSQWHIELKSKIVVSTQATFFGILIIFGFFIFVKYLVIRSECQRLPMMIFYLLTIANLGSRMAIMVDLNFNPFFTDTNLILSVVSLMFALMVGTSHAFILSTLIIDLKTLKCESCADYKRVVRLKYIYRLAVLVWTLVLLVNVALFLIKRVYSFTMLMEAIMFSIQTAGLLGINAQLNYVLSGLFQNNQFTRERRFLKCTLVVFTLSYFVVVVRSFFIYALITSSEGQVKKWICKHNFEVNLFNVTSYVFIDILPISTIFYLHWKNFREETKK